MKDNDFTIRIWEAVDRDCVNILIFNKKTNGREVVNFYTGESLVVNPNELIPDNFIMKIPSFFAPSFLAALAEALDKNGIKTDKDAKIQGTLDATKYHLEDLRKLLKLK